MYFLNSPKELLSKGVYRIISPAGSSYIGMTNKTFKERAQGHLKALRNGVHRCAGLKRAYTKYGPENLSFEILEDLDGKTEKYILEREQFWWDEFHSKGINLYNGRPTGTGSVFHSAETRERLSESMKTHYSTKKNKKRTFFCKNCGIECERRPSKILESSCCSVKCSAQLRGSVYDEVEITRLYIEEGLSTWRIAERLGLTQPGVLSRLTRAGVPRRSSGSYTKERVSYAKVCVVCGTKYEATSHKSSTCSYPCRWQFRKMKL